MGSLNPGQKPELMLNDKIKRTCYLVDFAVSTNHRVKMEESETIDK